jgi:tetratricopeptide (TPR) repeat protein
MTGDERRDRDLARALANRASSPCPGEEVLVAFYGGRLTDAESESVRDHLASCASCVALARDARAFVEAIEPASAGMSMARAYRWLAAAAVLAAVAIGAVWIARHRPAPRVDVPESAAAIPSVPPGNPWGNLTVSAAPLAAEDELVYRSGAPAGAALSEGLAAYGRGDYAAAEAALARHLSSEPRDARALYYRGVSLVLLGRTAEAIAPLESAAASPSSPGGARWYLALARLKTGGGDAALRDLDAVAAAPGPHREEAARLAEEVRHAVDARGR